MHARDNEAGRLVRPGGGDVRASGVDAVVGGVMNGPPRVELTVAGVVELSEPVHVRIVYIATEKEKSVQHTEHITALRETTQHVRQSVVVQ